MNLEDIQGIRNSTLGKRLDEILDFNSRPEFRFVSHQVLCRSLDEIAKVEKIVIEKTSRTDYGRCLIGVTEHHGIGLESIAYIATATARQRAEACYLCLLTGEKK